MENKTRVLFTSVDKETIGRCLVPTASIDMPKYIQFEGKLFQSNGSGFSAKFYKELPNFHILETKNMTRKEFRES